MDGKVLATMAANISQSEETPPTRNSTSSLLQTNWLLLCTFCQESRNERLACPAESKRQDLGAGYNTLANDIVGFSQIRKLPKSLK